MFATLAKPQLSLSEARVFLEYIDPSQSRWVMFISAWYIFPFVSYFVLEEVSTIAKFKVEIILVDSMELVNLARSQRKGPSKDN